MAWIYDSHVFWPFSEKMEKRNVVYLLTFELAKGNMQKVHSTTSPNIKLDSFKAKVYKSFEQSLESLGWKRIQRTAWISPEGPREMLVAKLSQKMALLVQYCSSMHLIEIVNAPLDGKAIFSPNPLENLEDSFSEFHIQDTTPKHSPIKASRSLIKSLNRNRNH